MSEDKKNIKVIESKIEVTPAVVAVVEQLVTEVHKVDFDGWYGARAPKIPKHHYKEIIKADFKARKIRAMATMAEFDEALRMYGIKL